MRRFAGYLLALAGVALTLVGSAVVVFVGTDDTVELPDGDELFSDDAAVLAPPEVLRIAGTTVHLTVDAGDVDMFVGAAHPVHLDSYLADVGHAEVVGTTWRGDITTRPVRGTEVAPPSRPADLDWWRSASDGAGAQTISIDVTDEPLGVVVMRSDLTTPVDADLAVSMEVDGVFIAGAVTAGVGLLTLVAGVALARSRRRRGRGERDGRRSAAPGVLDTPESTTEFDRFDRFDGRRLGRTSSLVGLVSGALLLSGCGYLPYEAVYDERPSLVAVDQAQVDDLLDHYTETVNEANADGDADALASVQTGPLRDATTFEQQVRKALDQGPPPEIDVTAAAIAAPRLESYPLWFVVTDAADDGSRGTRRYLFTRATASSPWKASVAVSLRADVNAPQPKAEGGVAARASAVAADRGAPVLQSLVAYAETGDRPAGVDITHAGDLANLHAQGFTVAADDDEFGVQTNTCELDQADDDVRWLTSAEGAVAIASISCTQTLELKPGFWFTTPAEYGTIPGGVDLVASTITHSVSFVLEVADDGSARVVGQDMRPTGMDHTLR